MPIISAAPIDREAVDAYKPVSGSRSAGWTAFDRGLPAGTVETEVGIAAVRGAYRLPYHYGWHVTRLDQLVQARWFTAACRAAAATHLGGIYFWSIGLGVQPTGPTLSNQLAWAGGLGARAISACFATLAAALALGRAAEDEVKAGRMTIDEATHAVHHSYLRLFRIQDPHLADPPHALRATHPGEL